MSTENSETRISGFRGTCHRCDETGHYAESTDCPWLKKPPPPTSTSSA